MNALISTLLLCGACHGFGEVFGGVDLAEQLLAAQARIGDSVHQFHALNDPRLDRRDFDHPAGQVGRILSDLVRQFKVGQGHLQPKFSVVADVFGSGADVRTNGGADAPDDGAYQAGSCGNEGDDKRLVHVVIAAVVPFLSAMAGYLFGSWLTWRGWAARISGSQGLVWAKEGSR